MSKAHEKKNKCVKTQIYFKYSWVTKFLEVQLDSNCVLLLLKSPLCVADLGRWANELLSVINFY